MGTCRRWRGSSCRERPIWLPDGGNSRASTSPAHLLQSLVDDQGARDARVELAGRLACVHGLGKLQEDGWHKSERRRTARLAEGHADGREAHRRVPRRALVQERMVEDAAALAQGEDEDGQQRPVRRVRLRCGGRRRRRACGRARRERARCAQLQQATRGRRPSYPETSAVQ